MRAFICEVDHHGLRRHTPGDLLPVEEPSRLARGPRPRSIALVWALLDEPDAEDPRAELLVGRHGEACWLLLNRAVEHIGLGGCKWDVPEDMLTHPTSGFALCSQ